MPVNLGLQFYSTPQSCALYYLTFLSICLCYEQFLQMNCFRFRFLSVCIFLESVYLAYG